jgi:glycosyltransferase involved in cell wall biosynthesis
MAPRVSVLTALHNHEHHIRDALDSLRDSLEIDWEVVVVEDGSSDGSGDAVSTWMQEHEDLRALLLRHPVNRGLAQARNSALAWARGEYCFVLDADNAIYPHCLARLIEALETDAQAAFSYGILERFSSGRPLGLLNTSPWEPMRFRTGNYVDAMALVRTRILRERLGGYTLDRRLHGWEDFDLWCRFVEAELAGAYVPEIVARYRTTEHSMISLTNLSTAEAFSVLIERHPRLMAGMKPPM